MRLRLVHKASHLSKVVLDVDLPDTSSKSYRPQVLKYRKHVSGCDVAHSLTRRMFEFFSQYWCSYTLLKCRDRAVQ